jgi:hypothetical protein
MTFTTTGGGGLSGVEDFHGDDSLLEVCRGGVPSGFEFVPRKVTWQGDARQKQAQLIMVPGSGIGLLRLTGIRRRVGLLLVVQVHPACPPRMVGRDSVEPNNQREASGWVTTHSVGESDARIECPWLRFVCSSSITTLPADSRDRRSLSLPGFWRPYGSPRPTTSVKVVLNGAHLFRFRKKTLALGTPPLIS